MNDDPGNLALVLNDPLAPGVLVWWRSRSPKLDAFDVKELALCLCVTEMEAKLSVHRCRTAGLIHDGGISPSAAKWLSALVAKSMGVKPSRRKKAED